MKRGILLVLAMLAAFAPPVPAASAAAPPSAVYEVYRLRATSRTTAVLTIRNTGSVPAPMMVAFLYPRREGGYDAGAQAFLPNRAGSYQRLVVDLRGAQRMFVAGPRGRTRIVVLDNGWGVREVRLGFRTVTSRQASASSVGGVLTSTVARAPSGAHGSVVVALTPCGDDALGVWTFHGGEGSARRWICGEASLSSYSNEPGDWVSEGLVTAVTREEYRLAVLDFPPG